jgi:LysM repeat protein
MKNLKIAGLVVGLHALALVLIFVNPGCSSTSKPAPVAVDTAPRSEAPPAIALAAPAAAPAVAASDPAAGGVRYSPTRPGTPVAVGLEAQPVAEVTPAATYVVVKGDTLSTVARRHHLTGAELRAANGLKAGAALRVGQKLVIPTKAGAAPVDASASAPAALGGVAASREGSDKPAAATAPKAPADAVKHVVKAGETLGSIARHYGVRMGDVATANNIADPKRIRPGQELIIPGKSAASKSGRSPKSQPATAPAVSAAAKPGDAAPAPAQDLDSGLKPAAPGEVPVVKVEDGPAPAPKSP